MSAEAPLNDQDEVYRHQGLGGTSGIGERCGLVLVDFVNAFVDYDQMGGPHIEAAARATVPLLETFRRHRLPVVFTRVVFEGDGANANVFSQRVPQLLRLTEEAPGSQVLDMLKPLPGEWVIRKQSASAFFETGLAAWLHRRGVDTAVVVGCTTSGCVRASVVDSMQHNFRTVVPPECTGDRALAPHEANLFDMRQKYADLIARDELIAHLDNRSARHA